MAEIDAKIDPDGRINLEADSVGIRVAAFLNPKDAALLARKLLACAAAGSCPDLAKMESTVEDARLPVLRWQIGHSRGRTVLLLTIPPDLTLTFEMPTVAVKKLGASLIAFGELDAPSETHGGRVH